MDTYEKVNKYVEKHGVSKTAAFEKLGVTSSEYYYYKKKQSGDPVTHEVMALEAIPQLQQLPHGNVMIAGAPADLAHFFSTLVGGRT